MEESASSSSCPPQVLTSTFPACVHSLAFNDEAPHIKGRNKRLMCFTYVPHVIFAFFLPARVVSV